VRRYRRSVPAVVWARLGAGQGEPPRRRRRHVSSEKSHRRFGFGDPRCLQNLHRVALQTVLVGGVSMFRRRDWWHNHFL
jgi:hypothetical protein